MHPDTIRFRPLPRRVFAVVLLSILLAVALAPASWARAEGSIVLTRGEEDGIFGESIASRADVGPDGFTTAVRDDDHLGDDLVLSVLEARDGRSGDTLTSGRLGSNGGVGGSSIDGFKHGAGCAVSCITSGVAHARRAGAELVVTTDTPAKIRIQVWGDGYFAIEDSAPGQYGFAALFDDLNAGTTYSAAAYAWDGAGEMHLLEGSFTTLHRHVEVKLPTVELVSTYWSKDSFAVFHWANGAYRNEFSSSEVEKLGQFLLLGTSKAGTGPAFSIAKVERDLDVRVGVLEARSAPKGDLCEGITWGTDPDPLYSAKSNCFAVAIARPAVPGSVIDLDEPAVSNSWLEHTIYATLSVTYGEALPSQLNFNVPAIIHVTYS